MNTINPGTRIQETQMKDPGKQGRRMVTTKKRRKKRSEPMLPAGESGAMNWKYVEADALNPKANFWRQAMANGWTPERRARQAKLIHRWKPWERSTGPRTAESKALVAQNGYKGGERPLMRALARVLKAQRREV
jgi:hypothetical protein